VLLTVTNLKAGPFVLQDPAGVVDFSLAVAGGDTQHVSVSLDLFYRLEPLLKAERDLFNITYLIADDPTSWADAIPPLLGIDGAVLMEHPVGSVGWGQIHAEKVVPAFAISSFTVSPTEVEIGYSVSPATFTASYNRSATGVTVDDGGGPTAVTLPATSFTKTGPYSKTALNATQGFTLSAGDGYTPVTATASIAWRPRVYYGVSAIPGIYDAAFITGLATWLLAAARQRTIAFNSPPGTKMYYAYPSSYGGVPANFIDNDTGFPAGFTKVASGVAVTNAYSVVTSYDIWESNQIGLGAVNVRVS
jgi:hypothetical protein